MSLPSATVSSSTGLVMATGSPPSKPWVWRSRRCQRTTWRSFGLHCEGWLRGDPDAMFNTWHPQIEWDTTHFEGWVENKVYRGQDEVRRFLEEWLASWDRESYEASFELLDKGEQVVVYWSQRMAGRGSGAPVK